MLISLNWLNQLVDIETVNLEHLLEKLTLGGFEVEELLELKIDKKKEIIIDSLSKQMSSRVRWVESIKALESTEISRIIEIGPGKILTGLIKRITDKFSIMNIENISNIKKIKNEN